MRLLINLDCIIYVCVFKRQPWEKAINGTIVVGELDDKRIDKHQPGALSPLVTTKNFLFMAARLSISILSLLKAQEPVPYKSNRLLSYNNSLMNRISLLVDIQQRF